MAEASFPAWLADILKEREIDVRRLLDDPAALHFLMAWSLFESKCFSGFLKPKALNAFAERILGEGFSSAVVEPIACHFHERFQNKKKLANLLHEDKTPAEVASQFTHLVGEPFTGPKPKEVIFLVAFVIYRYRNNVFHGNKGVGSWLQYGEQIRRCTAVMQAFVSHAESVSPSMSARAAA